MTGGEGSNLREPRVAPVVSVCTRHPPEATHSLTLSSFRPMLHLSPPRSFPQGAFHGAHTGVGVPHLASGAISPTGSPPSGSSASVSHLL